MDFGGRVVWITGASSGLGAHVARRLLARGATVIGTARRVERLEELADPRDGFEAAPGDVSDARAMQAIAERIRERHGRIDLALFAAGTWQQMPLDEWSAESIRHHLEINTMGVANGIEAVLSDMVRRGSGTIAGVASLAGYRGLPSAAPYSASKAATIALLESLRIDAGARGVRVVTINPGFFESEMTARNDFPMPFLISTEDAASAVVHGLVRDRQEIVFPVPMAIGSKALRLLPVSAHAAAFRRGARRGRG